MSPLVAILALSAVAASAAPVTARHASSPRELRLSSGQVVRQAFSRAGLLAMRAAALPAHVWPLSHVSRTLSYGEPLAGPFAKHAARIAESNAARGLGTVVGRLAPTLRDIWSVRGAERSFLALIDHLAAVRKKHAGADLSIAFDVDSLGLGLAAVPHEERVQYAAQAMLRIARHAQDQRVGIEIDMTGLESLPSTVHIARHIVEELHVPVRLAIAARHDDSDWVLRDWVGLAKRTGLKLGVRLVKGSYVEDTPGVIGMRRSLLGHYKQLITTALENTAHIDVAVASQNEEIYAHAQSEAQRLTVPYAMHVIRGVNQAVQDKMRADGTLKKEYVSYGLDGPIFGLTEIIDNWQARRAIVSRFTRELD